jgi:hypothetical protein
VSHRDSTTIKSANYRKRPTPETRPLVGGPGAIWIVWGRLYRDLDVLMLDHDGLKERVINPSCDDPPFGVGAWTVVHRRGGVPLVNLYWSDDNKAPRPLALPQKVAGGAWDPSYDAVRMLGEEPRRCSVWTISGGLPTLGKRR